MVWCEFHVSVKGYSDTLVMLSIGLQVMLEYIMEDADLEKAFMPTVQALYEVENNVVRVSLMIPMILAIVQRHSFCYTYCFHHTHPHARKDSLKVSTTVSH